ncbi:MAG: MauE/DoxX family redox-associated membrane protein [Bacteroidota bacterium]|nr:MauE/DoxX family redox-associated membrane protein [Bacteroidota bacterium]
MRKFNKRVVQYLVKGIEYLFVVLWVYAATAKLLNSEAFSIQLGQSPLLSAYAGILVWLVPLSEYVLSTLLLFPKTKTIGLYGSLCLMTAFTTYIIIILNYADFVPCSCGGILEALSWTEHLLFNIACILLALIALLLISKLATDSSMTSFAWRTGGILILAALSVVLLYSNSEQLIHHENPFIRRYSHGVQQIKSIDLRSASYYLAGLDIDTVYLGNFNTPLKMGIVYLNKDSLSIQNLEVSEADLPSTAVQLRVRTPHFYLIDGQISRVLQGNLNHWYTSKRWDGTRAFSNYALIDASNVIARAFEPQTGQLELVKISFGDSLSVRSFTGVLQKQIDGYFDIDGHLSFNSNSGNWVYTYNYRNNFLVLDTNLNLEYTGHTLDTITRVQLRIDSISKPGQHKLTGSVLVNAGSYASGGLLYVHSKVKGYYEPAKTWDQTETIDVYDLKDGSYRSSFYVYPLKEQRLARFFVSAGRFYGFIGDQLAIYDLTPLLYVTH